MNGPEGAAQRVADWTAATLPARLRLLEARLATAAAPVALPDPALVAAGDRAPLGLEDWPAVLVLPQNLVGMDPIELALDGAGEAYRCRYALRLLAWVRADGYEATRQLRDRYVLALREALLTRKSLTAAPAYGQPADTGTEFAVLPGTLREDYSDVLTDEARRTLAGAYVDVTVAVTEVLAGPTPYGEADTTTVTTQPAPDAIDSVVVHPGLM